MKLAIGLFAVLFVLPSVAFGQFQLGQPPSEQTIRNNLASQPLCFTENRGQWREEALFKAEAGGATFWFCNDEVAYQFTRDIDELMKDAMLHGPDMPEGMTDKLYHPQYKKESMVIRAQFVGANFNSEIVGENRLFRNNNYFYGNDPAKWRTDVANFSVITYQDIWPGIDLKYYGNGRGMKYDFIVNPGADVSQIRIRYDGVDNLSISNAGDLEAQTRFGLVYENIPEIYQENNGVKISVSGRYQLIEPGVFGFMVDGYNPSLTLVIDPTLVYSTYLGGNAVDYGRGIAVDGSGNVYVTGETISTDFPILNPYQTNQDSTDAFVTKLSASGNSVVYSTYLGGNSHDYGYGIAVNDSGNAYVTGHTLSTNFPTQNPYQTNQDSSDAFVFKLSPSGNSLVYSTYLGGDRADYSRSIAVDNSGNAYVTGSTTSTNFPIQNSFQSDQDSLLSDAFVTKFSPSGNSVIYSTYLGGSKNDYAWGIAIDDSGNAYVAGDAYSTDFPTQNPYQTFQGPTNHDDAFVTKLSSSGNSLVYSTYLGGNSYDRGYSIAVDSSGNAYATGLTFSTNFPTMNPYQQTAQGNYDVFVTKLSASGNSLDYSTYLGGDVSDRVYVIVVDDFGNAYVTGTTNSANFPLQNQYQNFRGSDAFVTKFSTSGNSLVYSTCLGGYNYDIAYCIAVDGSGNAYVTGTTFSTDFPLLNPYQLYQGTWDAFVTKLSASGNSIDDSRLPSIINLSQNYPNPFNAETKITYSLTHQSDVSIDIFDILGRRIAQFSEGAQEAGNHAITWDASGISSGVYFYRLIAGDYRETKRMTLVK